MCPCLRSVDLENDSGSFTTTQELVNYSTKNRLHDVDGKMVEGNSSQSFINSVELENQRDKGIMQHIAVLKIFIGSAQILSSIPNTLGIAFPTMSAKLFLWLSQISLGTFQAFPLDCFEANNNFYLKFEFASCVSVLVFLSVALAYCVKRLANMRRYSVYSRFGRALLGRTSLLLHLLSFVALGSLSSQA